MAYGRKTFSRRRYARRYRRGIRSSMSVPNFIRGSVGSTVTRSRPMDGFTNMILTLNANDLVLSANGTQGTGFIATCPLSIWTNWTAVSQLFQEMKIHWLECTLSPSFNMVSVSDASVGSATGLPFLCGSWDPTRTGTPVPASQEGAQAGLQSKLFPQFNGPVKFFTYGTHMVGVSGTPSDTYQINQSPWLLVPQGSYVPGPYLRLFVGPYGSVTEANPPEIHVTWRVKISFRGQRY